MSPFPEPLTAMTAAATDPLLSLSHYYLPVYKPRQVVLERGQGARVWDNHGREFIDLAAGIAVCGLGHNDPDLKAALIEQAGTLWHTSNVFYSEPPLRLAEELVTASRFAERVFLCNSGAEANEVAIKLVRKWASSQGRPADKRVIVTFRGSFHGRTLAAVMLEPIQGEGGVMPAKSGFLQRVRELCDQHNALVVLDEIQAGMGRTGTLFAHWQDGIKPDIVTLAKALGGGFPIGAMLAGPKVAEAMQFGAHGTTFGGNPLAAAVARVALRKLSSPEIAHNVGRQSQALREGLGKINDEFKMFSQVRGRGLMLGAVLDKDFAGQAGPILDHAAEHGLLTLQAGPDVLRFVPSLNISDEEVAEGLKRLRAAIQSFVASR